MFPVLFMEYSGKSILEFIHFGSMYRFIEGKNNYWTIFHITPGIIAFWRTFDGRYSILVILQNSNSFWRGGGGKETVLRRMHTGNRFYVEFYIRIKCYLNFCIFKDTTFWNKTSQLFKNVSRNPTLKRIPYLGHTFTSPYFFYSTLFAPSRPLKLIRLLSGLIIPSTAVSSISKTQIFCRKRLSCAASW